MNTPTQNQYEGWAQAERKDTPETNGPMWDLIRRMNPHIYKDDAEREAIYRALAYLRMDGGQSRSIEILEARLKQLNNPNV